MWSPLSPGLLEGGGEHCPQEAAKTGVSRAPCLPLTLSHALQKLQLSKEMTPMPSLGIILSSAAAHFWTKGLGIGWFVFLLFWGHTPRCLDLSQPDSHSHVLEQHPNLRAFSWALGRCLVQRTVTWFFNLLDLCLAQD